jgi:hypothetical protein
MDLRLYLLSVDLNKTRKYKLYNYITFLRLRRYITLGIIYVIDSTHCLEIKDKNEIKMPL